MNLKKYFYLFLFFSLNACDSSRLDIPIVQRIASITGRDVLYFFLVGGILYFFLVNNKGVEITDKVLSFLWKIVPWIVAFIIIYFLKNFN